MHYSSRSRVFEKIQTLYTEYMINESFKDYVLDSLASTTCRKTLNKVSELTLRTGNQFRKKNLRYSSLVCAVLSLWRGRIFILRSIIQDQTMEAGPRHVRETTASGVPDVPICGEDPR